MAPRETPKATPKVQRTIIKSTKPKASPVATIRKAITSKKTPEKSLKLNNATLQSRTRTSTVPKMSTPKPKEHKPAQIPSSASKSAKKATWKRRPKPAHSGVPVPEKMRKLLEKQLQDSDCSL
ncbi:titin-like [Vanessa atalanta]|uniref:titin-like n=1 Tax=Vanessa atalanta TaxID=42275 RepID=UPI001FCD24F2|nr:titin-like [Vanessa atalanta]